MEHPWSVRPGVAWTAVENKRSFARRKSRDPENMQATRRGRRLHTPVERIVSSVPAWQRGEAPGRRHAAGGTESL